MNNDRDTVLRILEAIDYSDDKEAFVDEFLKNVQQQAFINLVQALPQDKQEEIKNEFATENPEIVKKYFTEEQIQQSLEDTSKNAVMEWLQTINPTLADAQRQKLVDLSQELNPPTGSAV